MLINRPIVAHFLAQNKAVCAGIGAGFRAVVRILIKSWLSADISHEIGFSRKKSQNPPSLESVTKGLMETKLQTIELIGPSSNSWTWQQPFQTGPSSELDLFRFNPNYWHCKKRHLDWHKPTARQIIEEIQIPVPGRIFSYPPHWESQFQAVFLS